MTREFVKRLSSLIDNRHRDTNALAKDNHILQPRHSVRGVLDIWFTAYSDLSINGTAEDVVRVPQRPRVEVK